MSRTRTHLRWLLPGLVLMGVLLAVPDEAGLPCLPRGAPACLACHTKDLPERFPAQATRPCTPYCQACHFKDGQDPHHPVGTSLRKQLADDRLPSPGGRMGCSTCHNLATPRYDRVRWKAESLFDRLFRSRSQYKTYLLAYRNDQGQLCLACH